MSGIRKPKSEQRQRHAMVSVRFTADELAAVQACATKAGAPVSGFIRDLALRAAPPGAVPLAGNRTPGTADTCEFYQQGRRCREPGAGELRAHYMDSHGGRPWTLCAGHVKPEHHPADLRDKLVEWAGLTPIPHVHMPCE